MFINALEDTFWKLVMAISMSVILWLILSVRNDIDYFSWEMLAFTLVCVAISEIFGPLFDWFLSTLVTFVQKLFGNKD